MNINEEIQTKFTSPQSRADINLRYTSNLISTKQDVFMSQFDLSMPPVLMSKGSLSTAIFAILS